jgi:ribonuclease HI
MSARFAGTCRTCRQAIVVGEDIVDTGETGGLRWAHARCADDGPGELFSMNAAPSSSTTAGRSTPARGAPVTGASTRKATTRTARPAEAPVAGALEVWTDGACSGNPGPGGWAWATRDGRQGSGGAPHTTNQRMEVQAAYEAITALVERPLVVVSDSTYVVNCFRDGWWKGWLARGWVNSQKKPVANRDLWEPLIDAYQRGSVSFRWVKGHSGDEMNDLVDRLAVAAGKAAAR